MANHTQKNTKRKTRQEINEESRRLKRLKKRKGNPPGSRIANSTAKNKEKADNLASDPRIGSKKPVPLVGEAKKPPVQKPKAPEKLSPAQELEKLERDIRLDLLLERLENDEALSQEDQDYVDASLDRIDALMRILGIEDDIDDDEPKEKKDDILQLLRNK